MEGRGYVFLRGGTFVVRKEGTYFLAQGGVEGFFLLFKFLFFDLGFGWAQAFAVVL